MAKSKQEQQGRILPYKDFKLKKFKIVDAGVDVVHIEEGKTGGEVTKKGKAAPHPDLQKACNELRIFMADRLGVLRGWDYARDHLRGDAEALEVAIKKHQEARESCSVSGLSFSGEGDLEGVIITGSIKLPDGGAVGLALPKISFASDKLGYEDEIIDICEEIKKEVYAYRFLNKYAQLDLEDEIDKVEAEGKQVTVEQAKTQEVI